MKNLKVIFFAVIILSSYSLSLLGQNKVLFQDEFENNNSNWFTAIDKTNHYANVKNGSYHLKGFLWTIKNLEEIYSFEKKQSIVLETEIRLVSSQDNNKGYGIILFSSFRNENQIRFLINPAGYYKIIEFMLDSPVTLKDWTYSEAIKKGLQASNILKVTFDANDTYSKNIKFFINNNLLNIQCDSIGSGKKFGFVVDNNTEVLISFIKIFEVN